MCRRANAKARTETVDAHAGRRNAMQCRMDTPDTTLIHRELLTLQDISMYLHASHTMTLFGSCTDLLVFLTIKFSLFLVAPASLEVFSSTVFSPILS